MSEKYAYAIRHKPTGLYYTDGRNPTCYLSKRPKLYSPKPSIEELDLRRAKVPIEREIADEYGIDLITDGCKTFYDGEIPKDDMVVIKFKLEEVREDGGFSG